MRLVLCYRASLGIYTFCQKRRRGARERRTDVEASNKAAIPHRGRPCLVATGTNASLAEIAVYTADDK